MPDLQFHVIGVQSAIEGLTPMLNFKLEVSSDEPLQAVLLNVQIQFQCPQRAYNAREKEKLLDLFGAPERWGQTLRNRLWTQGHINVGAFSKRTEAVLPIQCTYDLNVASAKYFYALESGDISLLFLFSGSVFYSGADGRLQLQQVSWDKECTFSMSVQAWKDLMNRHYPNSGFICLHRDVLEELSAFKRHHGIATWEETIERLLHRNQEQMETPEFTEVKV